MARLANLKDLDRTIFQPLGRILQDIFGGQDHLLLTTSNDEKNVRINSRDYTPVVNKTYCGVQIKPNLTHLTGAGATVAVSLNGLEVSPRFADGQGGVSLTGIMSNPDLKGSGAAGNVSGEIRAYEAKVESASGSTRVVTGPVSCFKAGQAMHGTVTNGVFVLDADAGGGNVAWKGLMNLPDDGQLAKVSANMSSQGQMDGYIKVTIGSQDMFIQCWDTVPS